MWEKYDVLGRPNEYSINLKHYIKGLKIYDEDIIHQPAKGVPKVFTVTSLLLDVNYLRCWCVHPSICLLCIKSPTIGVFMWCWVLIYFRDLLHKPGLFRIISPYSATVLNGIFNSQWKCVSVPPYSRHMCRNKCLHWWACSLDTPCTRKP